MLLDGKTAQQTTEPTLPDGFSFRLFENEADIAHWCRIEASVNEFDSEDQARTHFEKEFGAQLAELQRRCIFIVNQDGLPVATAMGWFSGGAIKNRLHWIAVSPQYQGLGLGKAVSQMAVTVCAKFSPGQTIWLSTQTWSHRAVVMYGKLGFRMIKNDMGIEMKYSYIGDFDKAVEILRAVLGEGVPLPIYS